MPSVTTTEVLNHRQIEDRIRRIAWQIYENHQQEQKIILAGIAERGYKLAELFAARLQEISPLEVSLLKIQVNKKNPLSDQAQLNLEVDLDNQAIVVVDDVLNTGSTLMYGVRYFLDYRLKSIKTAVLVDRSHKNFPIKGDYKGISLSTSLMEHVEVQIDEEPYSVRVS